jgi:type I restriction enzyme S subunit
MVESIRGKSTGAAQGVIGKELLQSISLRLPPLPEQRRIVAILDEAFEGIAKARANAEKNIENARAVFDAYLSQTFGARGRGWVETTLGDLGKISMCKRIFKEETTTSGGIPFYKIGTFGKTPDAFISAELYREYRHKYPFPKKGDVLISASGTIGRRVVYDGEPAYFQDSNIIWLDTDETRILNGFLYHLYGACEWNATRGATISRLYCDNLRQLSVAFPSSLLEQRRLTARFDTLADQSNLLSSIHEQKLAALDDLKKSLLHHAFAGEL